MEECEVKFLNINADDIERRLLLKGATKVFDRVFYRQVYDFPDLRLNGKSAWVRVRHEGDKITLGFKQRRGTTSHDGSTNDISMDEIEVEVSDFKKTTELLERIGMKLKFFEENRRIKYIMNGAEYDIDFWPQLPPYLEIEAPSWPAMDQAISLLQLDPAQKKILSTFQIYQLHGINELDYERIAFDGLVKRSNP